MWPWCHLVEQQPAVSVDKEFDGEQADKINGFGKCLGGRARGFRQHRRNRRRCHGTGQNAVFMTVLTRGEMAYVA